MENRNKLFRRGGLILLLFLVAGIAYLPNISNFGYFNDDWYLMYAANAKGPGAFDGIYGIDRPARSYVMAAAYSLFGLNPLYYNLSAFLFKVFGTLAFLWALRFVWPRQTQATAVMALLFMIYPGFLSTPNAIDYQAQQVSLFLAMVSVAFSVRALVSSGLILRIVFWLAATLTAVTYLGLVEYFLGLEILRMGLIFVLLMRASNKEFWRRLVWAFSRYAVFLVGPFAFLIWRFFIFESERKATDIGAQLAQLGQSPLPVLVNWGTTLLQDSFEAIFLAWGVPLSFVWGVPLRLREVFFEGLLVAAGIGLILLIFNLERQPVTEVEQPYWRTDAFWLGLVVVIAGMVPVVLSNREANFNYFSRYMLASSAGAVILITAIIFSLSTNAARQIGISFLVVTAILTHNLNGHAAARVTENMRNFWWQVSWRIPQLKPETTLVANYSHASIEEDYFVWGPANLIYYPESSDRERLKPAVWAAVLTRDNIFSILNNESPKGIQRRSIITYMDYENILILTQPFSGACVQVIDGEQPAVSSFEEYGVMQIASHSNLGNITLKDSLQKPPEMIFGQEPAHTWCYYYETAALAFQRGDYEEVVELGREARKKRYVAVDPVEWMPFLQAAAFLGDQQEILKYAPKVKKDSFLANQACDVLSGMQELSTEMKAFISTTFCSQ